MEVQSYYASIKLKLLLGLLYLHQLFLEKNIERLWLPTVARCVRNQHVKLTPLLSSTIYGVLKLTDLMYGA